jgi:hypothetical protein
LKMITKRLNNLSKKHYKNPYKVPQSERSRRLGDLGGRKFGDLKNTLHILVILLLFILLLSSCHRNRLKINENILKNEIILEEKQKEETDKAARDKEMADTLNRFHNGLRFKENRSVDPLHPPLEIDIAGNLNNIKDLKLSDVVSGINYIRIQKVPDPSLPDDLKFKYYLMDNYIVAVNLYGIHLFAKDGRFLTTVVKNEFTNVIIKPDNIAFYLDYTMKGGGMSVWSDGNDLFYKYGNNITGQKYIMKYDCTSNQLTGNYKFDPENPDKISGLGKVEIDLNHGKTAPPKPRSHNGMFGGDPGLLFMERSEYMVDQNSYAIPLYNDNMMAIVNNQGDTLSTFAMLEKLTNYSKPMARGTDSGFQYIYKEKLFFRPEFNDTVFQVIPPNRLLPVYILKLGAYKVSKMLGIDPDFNLEGKIIPGQWAETNDFIYITYTKDSYDCKNNRNNKTVKIYHALYSKINKTLSVIKGDPYNYSPEILENNIDGGVPVWPSSYMIGEKGELLISLKGKELKERISSKEFELCKPPENRKNELKRFAELVSDSEDILMIVK